MELQELVLEEEEGRRERNGRWHAALYLVLPQQTGWHSRGASMASAVAGTALLAWLLHDMHWHDSAFLPRQARRHGQMVRFRNKSEEGLIL
jgi:hypothetical protein